MRSVSYVLAVGATMLLGGTIAAAEICSEKTFEEELSAVKDWTTLYAVYKRNLSKCPDDGFYAEGYSQSVTDLLAKNWTDLPMLRSLSSQDPLFRNFVLKHIDATADPKELGQIVTNMRSSCPTGSENLCRTISAHAKAALAAQ